VPEFQFKVIKVELPGQQNQAQEEVKEEAAPEDE